MSTPLSDEDGHVKDFEIAAYLDRRLPVAERDRLEDHLATCAECRQEVLDAQLLLQRVRRPRRLAIGGALAAAAAVLLIAIPTLRSRSGGDDGLVRDAGTTPALIAYGPTGEARLASLRFVWGAASNAVTYRISVTRADGNPVWSGSGADTVATLPNSIVLRVGERYFWMADALLSDGTTRSTGLREFGPVR